MLININKYNHVIIIRGVVTQHFPAPPYFKFWLRRWEGVRKTGHISGNTTFILTSKTQDHHYSPTSPTVLLSYVPLTHPASHPCNACILLYSYFPGLYTATGLVVSLDHFLDNKRINIMYVLCSVRVITARCKLTTSFLSQVLSPASSKMSMALILTGKVDWIQIRNDTCLKYDFFSFHLHKWPAHTKI